MNIYSHFKTPASRDGDYHFLYEGKWRSSKTMALLLRRRHVPEATFLHIDSGRRLTMVVGSWDWTAQDWDRRPVAAHYSLHFGGIFDMHEHTWLNGECARCRMPKDLHDEALETIQKATGGLR